MILSEKQQKTLDAIESMRKRIDLLDSHKTVGLITKKQYQESLETIVKEVEELEEEFGITDAMDAYDVLHGDNTPTFDIQMGHPMEQIDSMMEIFR